MRGSHQDSAARERLRAKLAKKTTTRAASELSPVELTDALRQGQGMILTFDSDSLGVGYVKKFQEACVENRFKEAKKIAVHIRALGGYGADNTDFIECLRIVCRQGNVSRISWVIQFFSITRENIVFHNMIPLYIASINGHFDAVKFLVTYFRLNDCDLPKKFYVTCMGLTAMAGYLEIAWWLSDQFEITPQIVRQEQTTVFVSICSNGHEDVARWYYMYYALTREEVLAFDNAAFASAIARGHTHIGDWMIEKFGITQDMVRIRNNELIRCVAYWGRLPALKWLFEKFDLGAVDINVILSMKCEHQEIVDWVIKWCSDLYIQHHSTQILSGLESIGVRMPQQAPPPTRTVSEFST
jgi:hypothetical protein